MDMITNPWVIVLATFLVNQASVFVTTIYLHRALTHRSIKLHPFVAFVMHAILTLFTGISPREWVSVHRKHHHFSDKEGDPHSPYLTGMWDVFFKNAWYYRRTAADAEVVAQYTKDYTGTLIDKIPGQKFGLVIGWLLFVLAFGSLWGSVAFVIHGVAYIHLNAAINSICHMIGYQNFKESHNKATNVRWIAWLTGGEGLHNNHHHVPTSANFAMRPGEYDPAWAVIWLFDLLGLCEIREHVSV